MFKKIVIILSSSIAGIISSILYFYIATEFFYESIPSQIPMASISLIALVGILIVLSIHVLIFVSIRRKFKLFANSMMISGLIANIIVFLAIVNIKVYF